MKMEEITQSHWDVLNSAQGENSLLLRFLLAAWGGDPRAQAALYESQRVSPAVHVQLQLLRLWLTHKAHFCVSPTLQAMFERTSLERIRKEDVQPPYPVIWVSFPRNTCTVWNRESGRHSFRGAYVYVGPDTEAKDALLLAFSCWGPPHDGSPLNDAVFNFSIRLTDEVEDLEESLERLLQTNWQEDISFAELHGEAAPSVPEEGREMCRDLARWTLRQTVNLLLYLTTENSDVQTLDFREKLSAATQAAARRKSVRKQRRAQQSAARTPRGLIRLVGGKTRPVRESLKGSSSGAQRPHWRRGHWHSFWTGPRKTPEGEPTRGDRLVRKFVAPVWVGAGEPDFGNTYVAER